MNRNKCPEYADLENYACGMLGDGQAAQIERHLDECPACTQSFSALETSTDGLLRQLRQQGKLSGLESLSEPEFHHAVESICRRDFTRVRLQGQTTRIGDRGTSRQRDHRFVTMFRPGDRLGQYELQEILGRGGMGVVFRARQLKLNRTVAIKLLAESRGLNENTQQRFEREMHAIGQLDHPNIVRALAADEIDGVHFLVMEYVSGTDLSRLLKTKGMLSIIEACDFAYQAALGLEHIHQNNMVHRDLKPGNLMVTNDRQVKILDLGLALLNEAPVVLGGEVTKSGQVMGTLDYMAPEQCDETHTVDIRADIYSLGATLFALITGMPPFPSRQFSSLLQKLNAIAHATAPDILKSRSDVPHELATMISCMLANNPADRFQTPGEVAESLLPFCTQSKRDSATALRDQAETISSKLRSSSFNTALPVGISPLFVRVPFFRGVVAVLATVVLAAIAVFSVSGLKRTMIDSTHSNSPDHLRDAESMSQQMSLGQNSSKRKFRSQRELAQYVISLGGSVFTHDEAGHSDWRSKVEDLNNDSLVVMGVRFPRGTDISVAQLEPVLQAPSLGIFEMMFHQCLTREHLACLRELLKPDELHTLILGTLSDSEITDEDIAALVERLPRLRGVCLMHLSLEGSFIDAIVHPENVEGLTVTSPDKSILVSRPTTVTVRFMETLKTFPALETLELTNGKLTTDHYKLLAECQSLKTCRLINTAAVAENLESIASLPRLESLNLMGTSLTDAHVAILTKANRLILLDLRNNGISRDGIGRLHAELPGCVIESDFGRFEPTGTDSAAVDSTRLLQEIQANPKRPDQGSDAPSPWQIFSSSVEPDLRSDAIHRAATILPASALLTRLPQEQHPSTRAGLLMALSEFDQKTASEAAGSLSPQPFDLINLLLHWYVEDPDPEVHSCVELLLRSWQQDSKLAELRPVIEQKLIPFDGGWYQPYHVSSMVVIPGPRTAMLGSPDSEPGRSENADQMEELRTVTIPYTFAISSAEITKQQYWRMGQNYWETEAPKNPQCPVNNVHWQKAAEFCNRLSTLEGLTSADHCYEQFDSGVGVLLREKSNALQLTGYRLPTDDEWEIACRAETKTVRPDGNSSVWMKRFVYSSDEATPVPNSVACCKPNPLGLFDMIGNVSEWTHTPFLDSATKLQMRRIRGGSVWTRAEGLRSAARYGYAEEVTSPKIGFRVARTLIRRPFDLTENNGEHTNRVEILAGPPACPETLQDFSPTEFEPLTDHQVVRIGHWDVRDIPTRRFQLRNNSDQPLRLKEIPWTGDLFEFEEAPPLEIPANSSVDFALRMTAKSVGERTHDLMFTIDGLDENALPPLRIHGCLRGTLLSVHTVGFLGQEPVTVDFGTVPRGARAGRRLYLYNTGDTTPEAVVTSVTGPFRLVEQLEGPIVKLQNSFRIELDAQTVGLASGDVTVELKADSSGRLTFPVKAFISEDRSFSHIGLFRNGRWLIDFNRDGSVDEEFDFGTSGDQPLTGDWNSDGICDVGVWRKNSNDLPTVQLRLRGDKTQPPLKRTEFSLSGANHYPIGGDIDGDGKTELGCVIPASSGDHLVWAFDLNHDGIFHDAFTFGRPGDIPLIGDWNGDGRDEAAISRCGSHLNPLDRIWEVKLPDVLPRRFASSLDVPLAGDWDGDGDDDFGAWRPVPNSKTGIWQFDSDGDTQPDSDLEGFGTDNDIPVVLRATHQLPE